MARLWVRLLLAVAGLSGLTAAGAFLWSTHSQIRSSDAALRLAADAGRRAFVDASDLRFAQPSYVAVGQGEDFWIARVSSLTKDLDDVLGVFRGHLSSAEALAAADVAAGALRDFQQVDARARDYAHAGQLAQASDVIFGDGFELTQKLTTALTQALSAESVAHDAAVAEAQRRQYSVLAAGAGIAALALLLLIADGRRQSGPGMQADPRITVPKQTLGDINERKVVAQRAPATPQLPGIDIAELAAICSDLTRVVDTRAVPQLLERAARVLDAAGIVLWIADPDGRELSPIVVHGYSQQMASRLGTIPRDAANVTASAYRTALMQTVKGDSVSNGAIAAPLTGTAGCLGVMAVEMRNGGEQREPLLAAATIFASQLSTLVGPPSSRARAEAAG